MQISEEQSGHSNIFGMISVGRLVTTDCLQLSEVQFTFDLQAVENVNHICVFLTGVTPLPDGFSAAVYYIWPDDVDNSVHTKYLGYLSNDKPSVIFKLSQVKPKHTHNIIFGSQDPCPAMSIAKIGLSIEAQSEIEAKEPDQHALVAHKSHSMEEFAQKMCESVIAHVSSFAKPFTDWVDIVQNSHGDISGGETFVPLKVIESWYNKFSQRLQNDVNFWKNL